MASGSENRSSFVDIFTPILWVGVIFLFSLSSDPGGDLPGWITAAASPGAHLSEFLLLGILVAGIPALRNNTGILLIIGLIIAIGDESVQSFVPGRAPDVVDVILDIAGYSLGVYVAKHATRLLPFIRYGVVFAFIVSVLRFI